MSWTERGRQLRATAFTLLCDLLFKRWDSPVFEPAFWGSTMTGIRIVLPLVLALLLLSNTLVQRGFGVVPKTLRDKAALGFVVAGFFTYYAFFNPNVRNGGLYQVNAYYQQFFEAKYHAELDSTWLFDCTIAAEKQLGRSQQLAQRPVRSHVAPEDVKVAGLTLGIEDPTQCINRFSDERWSAFKADVAAFAKLVEPKLWNKLQAERRVVVTPTWLTLAPWLSPTLPSENAFRWTAAFQLALHAGTLAVVALGFGWVPAAVTSVVWGCQPFMPFDTGVELFQNLWLELLLCGCVAWHTRRWLLGIVALSLGVALQPVALFAVLAPALIALRSLFATSGDRPYPRALGPGLIGCTLLCLALGCVNGSYDRYASAHEFQASVPHLNDVGLASWFAHSETSRYSVLRQDVLPDPARPWAQVRSQRLYETQALTWVVWGAVVGGVLFLAWARGSLWLAVALGLVPCTLWLQPVSACIGFLALVACTYRQPALWPALLSATAGAVFLANHSVFADDRATTLSGLLALTTVTLLVPLVPRLRWSTWFTAERTVTTRP